VAAHYPERVDRLVVCCTAAKFGTPEGWAERAAKVLAEGTESVADLALGRWFTPGFRARQPAVFAEARAGLAATPAAGYAACCGAIGRMDLRDDVRRIGAPALAVAGADDPSTTPEDMAGLAAAIPGCRLAVVDGAAHLANLEQPEAVTRLIDRHLGGGAQAGGREHE
jgi:3-oxoadipate enol-lactonase